MADTMPTPNADAVLAEIDKLAQALVCRQQKLRLAGVRAQLAQIAREAWTGRAEKARGSALLP
jgi:hypothetical protein